MYRFSRSIYRELATNVAGREATRRGATSSARRLRADDLAGSRIDRRYFARPARSSVHRGPRPLPDRRAAVHVYKVIERHISLAVEHLDSLPPDVCLDGVPRQCRASTRKGTPCQREPLPGRDYCPSHKHLEEPGVELAEARRDPPRTATPRRDPLAHAKPDGAGRHRPAPIRPLRSSVGAPRSRRRRDLHRRRPVRRRAAPHGEGADHARRPVRGRDGGGRRGPGAGRRRRRTTAREPSRTG